MNLSIIYASTLDHAIGAKDNRALVLCQQDQDHFKRITQYSPCNLPNLLIVGRKTWETIPEAMRKCRLRKFLVLSRQNMAENTACIKNDFRSALEHCIENRHIYHKFFVIGGAEVYRQAMDTGLVGEIFQTQFLIDFGKELPHVETTKCGFNLDGYRIDREHIETNLIKFQYSTDESYKKSDVECLFRHYQKEFLPFETQYLSLVDQITTYGIKTEARNAITLSLKDRSIKIDLADGFPILTTRRSFWKGINEELLWMMSGSTDVGVLQQKGVHIWDGNSSREFLDKCGLSHLAEGDIGPGYGFQMRYSGAKYIDCKTDYTGQGVDQLVECINLIKNNPSSRRTILNLWNVEQLKEMALPPCHFIYQFSVTGNKLSCHLYQRSWDIMLGWNTSTAALLTHILAHYCDLEPGIVTHTICDIHVYVTHLEAYQSFKNRLPYKLAKLEITGPKPEKIDGYSSEQFKLVNYQAHPSVKMEMIP